MPTMPPTFRPPGMRTKRKREREHDARRYEVKPWRGWYSLSVWCGPNGRRVQQLNKQPYCERHLARGKHVLATVANHKQPHRGDWDKFIGGELESLCKACHDREAQKEERAAKASTRLRHRTQGHP